MPSTDIFDEIAQQQQPVPATAAPMSNRRRAMAAKQEQSPFDAIEIPPAVQAQMGAARGQQPAAAPVVTPQAAPKLSIGKGRQAAVPMPAAEPFEDEGLRAPRASILDRIRDVFAGRNARQLYRAFIDWVRDHDMWFILVTVALIAVGLLVTRYISFGGAIILLILGYLVNREPTAPDSFVLYICALVCFIVPYLF